ncbi:hypothetical protein GIB67_017635 [Kingdonia uniflora]|uniref:Dihydroorotate dehydrogenase (quinone), mitochondrial n=1 Tax=Kingdonia uniflora TaxID=39325 RepID=A0A7J7LN03_9MAGN|nr:hypothetical protein GIB67_017635 [Kingdonia uniflora]
MRAISRGQEIADEMGIPKLAVATDSKLMVSYIKDGVKPPWQCKAMMKTIRRMSTMMEGFSIEYENGECRLLLIIWLLTMIYWLDAAINSNSSPSPHNPNFTIKISIKETGIEMVINVSSPNTPGLRKLQGRKQLKDLVKKVQAARDEMQWGEEGPPPLLVKIAPDLSSQDLEDIAAVALTLRLDGLIISNTTISRPDPVNKYPVAPEPGGLSGRPVFNLSTNVLKEMYILTRGKIPLIGCGGVSSGEDVYKKIRAGATLVQMYTAFAYGGPALIPQVKAELAECLERDGFKSVHEAVGADSR